MQAKQAQGKQAYQDIHAHHSLIIHAHIQINIQTHHSLSIQAHNKLINAIILELSK